MQFLYHKQAGEEILKLKGEEFAHLKARRIVGGKIKFPFGKIKLP